MRFWLSCLTAVAALTAACGEERACCAPAVPDASVWYGPSARWERPDGGASGYALLTNSLGNSVSVLDLGARRVVTTAPIGVVPLRENGPHHLAVDPIARAIYMPLSFPAPGVPSGPHAAHGSSALPGAFIKRSLDDFRLLGRVDIDPNPGEMLLSPDGRRAYVSHFDLVRAQANRNNRDAQRSNLIAIDTRTMQRLYSVPMCVAAHGMTLSPDGDTVYAACYGDDALAVVSVRNDGATVRLVPIRGELSANPTSPTYGPYAVTRSIDGRTVWVGCTPPSPTPGNRGLLIPYDVAAGRFDATRATTALIGTPFFGAYAPDGNTMVIPLQNADALARVAVGPTFRVIQQVPMNADECVLPHQVAYGPDGRVYLVCEGVHDRVRQEPGTVLALNPDTLAVEARFTVGPYPDAIVFMGAPR